MIRKIFIALSIALILFQFYRPEKNLSGDKSHSITTKYSIPQNVKNTLEIACFDCHSNTTKYPWYSNLQPGASFMAGHVKEGKKKLNFDNFTSRRVAIQNHKLEEIAEMIEEGKMPLLSYTFFHRDAILNEVQKKEIIDWTKASMDSLRNQYPADSLILKKK